MWYVRLAYMHVKYSYKTMLTYRMSFILNAISQFISYAVDFALMWIMVNSFGNMNGWIKYEVMLLYAMSLASYAIAGFFFFTPSAMVRRGVHSGEFDDVLVKPVSVIPYLICSNFNIGYFSHISLSVVMMIICFTNIPAQITFGGMAFFILTVIMGALIYGALFILICVPVFFTTKLDSVRRIVFFFRQMSYYPLSIFNKALQVILSFIIPYGMINFFPVQAVIGKSDFLMFGSFIPYVAPFYAILLFSAAVLLFNFGVKHYKSTGS